MSKITPFLWFDHEAEEAANFYVSIIPNSKITAVQRMGEDAPGQAAGVITVSFELDGRPYTALNGGPHYKLNEAFSLVVNCDDQAEVDRMWDALLAGGGSPSQCGWLKDRFGLSWQVVPRQLPELIGGPDRAKAKAAMAAMLKMVKLDIPALEAARAGA